MTASQTANKMMPKIAQNSPNGAAEIRLIFLRRRISDGHGAMGQWQANASRQHTKLELE
jgi:hypothetical protein